MMSFEIPKSLSERVEAEASRRGVTADALIAEWLGMALGSTLDVRDTYTLANTNPDLIARFNRQFQYTYLNPAAASAMTRPMDEVIGRTFYEIGVEKKLADYLTEQLRTLFSTGRESWFTYDVQIHQQARCYEAQIIPVLDADGRVEAALTVSRDVTSRKAAEAALRESERRYRNIVEGQIDLVCLYYPDTTIAYVNDSYCEYFRKPREEIVGRSFLRLTDPQERTRIMARLEEVLRDPRPRVQEYQLTDAGGTVHWISWVDHGIVDDAGDVVMVQAIGRDITHMKRIEQQLDVERERYQLLFDENPVPLFVYDSETTQIRAVNNATVRAYGYTHEELFRMSILNISPEAENPDVMTFVNELKMGRPIKMVRHWRHRRKDGSVFTVEATGRDIVFDGRRARLVMVIDVTERLALESERMYTQSLEIELQKEREITLLKERFTSMVTHEFRTPLSVIVSTIDILKNYLDRLTKENIARKLDIVTAEAKRMSSLLDDVLLLSRATAGRLRVTPEQVDLVDVVRGLIENLRLTDSNIHHFAVDARCEQAEVVTDRRLIEQIMINLLTNAVKYSAAGTTITAEVCSGDDHVTLKVIDQGRGIPEADQPRIFEAFHRAENATGIEGTGLGLAIVKESIGMLGGEIKFESRVDEGTTFTIHLPLETPANEPSAALSL